MGNVYLKPQQIEYLKSLNFPVDKLQSIQRHRRINNIQKLLPSGLPPQKIAKAKKVLPPQKKAKVKKIIPLPHSFPAIWWYYILGGSAAGVLIIVLILILTK